MARTVSADLAVTLNVGDSDPANTLGADTASFQESYALAYGAAPDPAATRAWSGRLTLAAAPTVLDLTALPGVRGTTEVFTEVRAIYLYNTDATAGHAVTVGGGTNPWTPGWSAGSNTAALPAASRLLSENRDPAAGWAVDSTHKTLRLDPGAATVTVRAAILGS